MLSEWVVDPPTHFEHWTMVVCPTGKRVLVVAHKVTPNLSHQNILWYTLGVIPRDTSILNS